MRRSTRRAAVLAMIATAFASGCVIEAGEEETDRSADEIIRKTAETSRWSYRGPMPELQSPRLVVSLAGHTVRVSGFVSNEVAATLPFHAITEPDPSGAARTLVTVVYPIATVKSGETTTEGLPARNAEPGSYRVCRGGNFWASNRIGAFGGFPFIEYVCNHRDSDGRVRSGIAFHGPITSLSAGGASYWTLKRGPVSHACNRMLGEHVLEMAHLIGFDRGVLRTPVQVVAGVDTWHGHPVDVDYPATGFERPAGALVFPTWQALSLDGDGVPRLEFPQWACETSRCAAMPANRTDAETGGRPIGPVVCPAGFEEREVGRGTLCASNGEALGPFTKAMTAGCEGAYCAGARWPVEVASRLRGGGVCPAGARFDALTGYCAEGVDAFGPFPTPLVDACLAATGESSACRTGRWNRFLLTRLQRRVQR